MTDTIIDLYNDQTWTTQDGRTYQIDELEERHARNILRYLERHAARAEFVYSWNALASMPDHMGEMAEDCLMSDMDRSAADPVSWMRRQPAYTAVKARVDALNATIPDLEDVW